LASATVLRTLFSDSISLARRRSLPIGVALVAGIALPLLQASLAGAAGHSGAHGSVSLAAPADAAPANVGTAAAPSPGDTQVTTAAGAPVHLPVFGESNGGAPAPAPRAGSVLTVPSVGLQVGVVDYGDCSGNTAMTRTSAVHFLCTPSAVTTFVGHNPGVFTPLLRTHTGDQVVYRHDGVQDTYVIRSQQRVTPEQAAAASQDGSYVHAVFATCAEPDSSAYWIFLADPVGAIAQNTGQNGGQSASKSSSSSGSGSGGSSGAPNPAPQPSPSPTPPPGPVPGVPLPVPPPPPAPG
jgi:hypothetical protein